MGASHGHGHAHGEGRHAHAHHRAGRASSRRRLALALGLTLLGLVAEVVGGVLSNSLALLADAGHLLSDAGALGLAAFAGWMASRPATARRTYGHHRAEILAALLSGAVLIAMAILVVYSAARRLAQPEPVRGGMLLAVATFGLLLNLACLWVLAPARASGLNARAAWLHVMSDALGSVGAVIAGAFATWGHAPRADAIASIVIALLVAWSAWSLVREATAVLMESAPAHVDVDALRDALRGCDGVVEVHDLHVWSITSGIDSLSAHVVIAADRSHPEVLRALQSMVAARFGIHHATLQIEPEGCDVEARH